MAFALSERKRYLEEQPTFFGEKLKPRVMAPPGVRVRRMADHFCGLGGSSTGARWAIEAAGEKVEAVAINHKPLAVAAHEGNHPDAIHYCESIHAVPPALVFPERHLDLLMSSPSCKPHSSAASGHEFTDEERSLCWSVLPWLIENRVDHLIMENVRGFMRLGPGHDGSEFRAFVNAIRSFGYRVEHRLLDCADYGIPQERRRVFLLAKRGGGEIHWPARTHGDPTLDLEPPITGREIVDFTNRGELVSQHVRLGIINEWIHERIEDGKRLFGGEPFLIPRRMGRNTFVRSIDRPLMTIMTDPGVTLAHRAGGRWYYRKLTVNEYLRAMSFDESYFLPEDASYTACCELIGNAVPPLMMQRLVEAFVYGGRVEERRRAA